MLGFKKRMMATGFMGTAGALESGEISRCRCRFTRPDDRPAINLLTREALI